MIVTQVSDFGEDDDVFNTSTYIWCASARMHDFEIDQKGEIKINSSKLLFFNSIDAIKTAINFFGTAFA